MQLSVILPAVVGMLASLAGVTLGGVLTRRAQAQQWSRDRLTHACLLIMNESSRIQIALHRYQRGKDRPDWVSWNEALATIVLTAPSGLVQAALAIDETFWRTTDEIEAGQASSGQDWERIRASIEAARLAFANRARRELAGRSDVVTRLAARPRPLARRDLAAPPDSGGAGPVGLSGEG
ncbi:hypothetical protein B0I32_118259 [Nonomuraea fuscirosea]|uniref:Uncharacterized protein n=1 Tax=Nonomuraea fuscirosea TaxID=1291556 RepID=A0A2T0MPX0_9ACTN|nr:hypothetical protein [Nonomuraea fuscirosea]PRX60115.1 hypothetical protein B0I32_118259 [Nonomuraea fuscirosea]